MCRKKNVFLLKNRKVLTWWWICTINYTGLVYKKLDRKEEALDCFYKLHSILRNHPEVMVQIAKLYPWQLIYLILPR